MNLESWTQRAEIIASFAVVVTLVFLLLEVRSNTLAIERQAHLDRAESMAAPFLATPDLARVLAKVKAVDGMEPLNQAFAKRYDLSAEESIVWVRHLSAIWDGLQADYTYTGQTEQVDQFARSLLSYPDNQMYWKFQGAWYSADFRSYVESILANQ
jgi:hypothetical protein